MSMGDAAPNAAATAVVTPYEYGQTAVVVAATCAMSYVLLWRPFRAGLWTGRRARRHKFHRYMGLAYLVQYFCAWIEFFVHYERGGATSYLPHFIAVNGVCVCAFLGACLSTPAALD
jgi:hypothetical protein